MLIHLIQTQSLTFFILGLFLLQKNGRLEKEEAKAFSNWTVALFLVNLILYCLAPSMFSSLEILMLASINGLATIAFLFSKTFVLNQPL